MKYLNKKKFVVLFYSILLSYNLLALDEEKIFQKFNEYYNILNPLYKENFQKKDFKKINIKNYIGKDYYYVELKQKELYMELDKDNYNLLYYGSNTDSYNPFMWDFLKLKKVLKNLNIKINEYRLSKIRSGNNTVQFLFSQIYKNYIFYDYTMSVVIDDSWNIKSFTNRKVSLNKDYKIQIKETEAIESTLEILKKYFNPLEKYEIIDKEIKLVRANYKFTRPDYMPELESYTTNLNWGWGKKLKKTPEKYVKIWNNRNLAYILTIKSYFHLNENDFNITYIEIWIDCQTGEPLGGKILK